MLVGLFLAFVLHADDKGRSVLHYGTLYHLLPGHRAGEHRDGAEHVDGHTIARGRDELAGLELVVCDRDRAPKRLPDGKLRDHAWQVQLTGDHKDGYRWPQAGRWIGAVTRMVRERRLRLIEQQVGLYLALNLDATGALRGLSRDGLAQVCGVSRNTVVDALHTLEAFGLLAPGSSRDDRETAEKRPYRYSIVATVPGGARAPTADETAALTPEIGEDATKEPDSWECAQTPLRDYDIEAMLRDDPDLAAAVAEADRALAAGELDEPPFEVVTAPASPPAPAPVLAEPVVEEEGGRHLARRVATEQDTPTPEPEPEPVARPAPTARGRTYRSRATTVPAHVAGDGDEIAVLAAKEAAAPRRLTSAEANAVLDGAAGRLWYPDLVREIMRQRQRHHRTDPRTGKPRTIAAAVALHHYVEPILKLQETTPAPVLKDALRKTIGKRIADRPPEHHPGPPSWLTYAQRICADTRATAPAPRPGTPAAAEAAANKAGRTARDLLARASMLNSRGEQEAAHTILDELLALTPQLAPLFDSDAARAKYQLRLAYKQGGSDLHCARNRYANIDFYPEWSPDGETQTDRAAQPTPAPTADPEPAAAPSAVNITVTPEQLANPSCIRKLRAAIGGLSGATPVSLSVITLSAVGERRTARKLPLTISEDSTEQMRAEVGDELKGAVKRWRHAWDEQEQRRQHEQRQGGEAGAPTAVVTAP